MTGVTDATAANLVGGNTLQIVSTSLGDIDLQLDPEQGFLGDYFHVNTIGGNAVVTENTTPCYLAGTRILTDARRDPGGTAPHRRPRRHAGRDAKNRSSGSAGAATPARSPPGSAT